MKKNEPKISTAPPPLPASKSKQVQYSLLQDNLPSSSLNDNKSSPKNGDDDGSSDKVITNNHPIGPCCLKLSKELNKNQSDQSIVEIIFKTVVLISIVFTLCWFHFRLLKLETVVTSSSTSSSAFILKSSNSYNNKQESDQISKTTTRATTISSSDYFNNKATTIENGHHNDDIGYHQEQQRAKTSKEHFNVEDAEFSSTYASSTSHRVKRRVNDEGRRGNSGNRGRTDGEYVEIINPRLREEMEAAKRAREGYDENAVGGDGESGPGTGPILGQGGSDPDWVWLTSYSRIPAIMLHE